MGKGDHIYVKRGGYSHHGIDLNDGTIVHFSGVSLQKVNSTINRTSYLEFLQDEQSFHVVAYSPKEVYAPDIVIERALNYIGKNAYDLFSNNCEHFASECKSGKKKSTQVRESISKAFKMSMYGARGGGWAALLTGVGGALFDRLLNHGFHQIKKIWQEPKSNNLKHVSSLYNGLDGNAYLQNAATSVWFMLINGSWLQINRQPYPLSFYGHLFDRDGDLLLQTLEGWHHVSSKNG